MKSFSISKLFPVLLLLCSTPGWSVDLPNPPKESPAIYARSALVSSAMSNWTTPSESAYMKNQVSFTLNDGTQLGGLFFPKNDPNPAPLLIVNFGALADRWFNTTRDFILDIVLAGKIDAHVLIVDAMSSAGFYVGNSNISLGGYDEGRVLVELARKIREKPMASISSIHLMGVSLGGLATMHALIEDDRLDTRLFQSAITFSGVVDEESDTRTVMNTFGYKMIGASDEKLPVEGRVLLVSTVEHFDSILKENHIKDFHLKLFSAGGPIYQSFEKRLHLIDSNPSERSTWPGWNEAVSLSSVEEYVRTSSLLTQRISQVHVPLIMVHSKDDPVVPYSEFKKFADEQASNPNIQTLSTSDGGHWGFEFTYGADWIAGLLNRMFNSR
jgi:pimeloyl-ACP methyl ester carboxylesterase